MNSKRKERDANDGYMTSLWGSYGGARSRYRDEDGNPVRRTKDEYPYSYDAYVQWQKPGTTKNDSTGGWYSDRMLMGNWDLYNRCHEQVWGNTAQIFFENSENGDPQKIEQFCRLYCDSPELELISVLQMCNASNGNPLWYFRWREPEKPAL